MENICYVCTSPSICLNCCNRCFHCCNRCIKCCMFDESNADDYKSRKSDKSKNTPTVKEMSRSHYLNF